MNTLIILNLILSHVIVAMVAHRMGIVSALRALDRMVEEHEHARHED